MGRAELDDTVGRVAEAVAALRCGHPVRVAVDGAPGAGKTTLADAVRDALPGRPVIRATVDDFLFPRERRYARGEYSAEGCYFDAHDWAALNRVLLDPLGPGGDRRYRCGVHDRATDHAWRTASDDAVLLFDGVFLMRPEVADRWDLRVFVSVALEKTVERAVRRERGVSSRAAVERRWRERYLPAQRLYFEAARPAERADIVVHNDDGAG